MLGYAGLSQPLSMFAANAYRILRYPRRSRWPQRWLPIMPGRKSLVGETNDWSGLIVSIATRTDQEAFTALFQHFAPRVKSFMKRSGLGEAMAEELAQETLVVVWRKAALFNPTGSSASAWIFTIARNLRIDALRREKRGSGSESDIDAELLVDESPPADIVFDVTRTESRVRDALQGLPDEQLRVVELSFYHEKAHAKIAATLNIPLGTVKSRLRLAMSKLRTILEGSQ